MRANDLPQMPQLQVDIDNNKAVSLGLSLSDVTDTLSSAWGGTYVNDFIDRGRVKRSTSGRQRLSRGAIGS